MSNETKVSLAGICNVLQNAKKYEDPDRAFKVLWDGTRRIVHHFTRKHGNEDGYSSKTQMIF